MGHDGVVVGGACAAGATDRPPQDRGGAKKGVGERRAVAGIPGTSPGKESSSGSASEDFSFPAPLPSPQPVKVKASSALPTTSALKLNP